MAVGLCLAATSTQAQQAPTVSALKKLSVEQLMDIEVTSVSRTAEKLLDVPSAIQVVTGEDIRRSGATSIPEALRLADNLAVAQKNSHDWAISARGFNTELANKLLVLVDGRTVYTPLYSGVFWNRQDTLLADLDRIEVISGPGGTLWGANAVNGVINIVSKSSRDTQGYYAEAAAGDVLNGSVGARYGGTLSSGTSFRVYGKYLDRGDQALLTGADAGDAWHQAQGGFRLDATPSPQNAFTLQGDLYYGHDGLPTGGRDDNSGGNLLGRWTRTLSGDSDFSLQFYYDRTHLSEPVPALAVGTTVLAPGGRFADTLDTYDLDFQHHFRWGRNHKIVWGGGYRFSYDSVTNAPSLAFFPALQERTLVSAFAQDQIDLGPDVSVTLGTKIEHNDYTGFEADPTLRVQWNPVERQTLWAAVSSAVRTPSRIDTDVSTGAPPYFVLLAGGEKFVSEKVVAWEAGHRAQFGHRLATTVSAFYNVYDDLRSTSLNSKTIFPLFFENSVKGETTGVEVTATFRATDWWTLRAGYTLLEEDLRVKGGQSDFNNALNETADPRHQASLRSSLDLPHGVSLDAHLRYVDSLRVNSSGVPINVPAYAELDVRLAWQVDDRVEVSLTGQNLLHQRHQEYILSNSPREDIRQSFYGKVAWRF